MQLCSLWVLMVVLPSGSTPPTAPEGADIEGMSELSWVANNTRKLSASVLEQGELQQCRKHGVKRGECWTIISSREFAAKHKCPQEAIPAAKDTEVKRLMLSAFERALGLPPASLRPVQLKVQLWGAAVPINVLRGGAPGPGCEQLIAEGACVAGGGGAECVFQVMTVCWCRRYHPPRTRHH